MTGKRLLPRMGRRLRDRQGASLLISVVITFCLVMLSLSILLAAYSLFNTVSKRENVRQCHELALSLSEALEKELTADIYTDISTAEDFANALDTIRTEHPLWYYLRAGIFQGEVWRWYDEEDLAHSSDVAWHTFQVGNYGGTLESGYDLTLTMYWESDAEEAEPDMAGDAVTRFQNATPDVVLMVTCTGGKAQSTVTTRYKLTVDTFSDDEYPVLLSVEGGRSIYSHEKWSFSLINRR